VTTDRTYYAVPDPTHPAQMTYWADSPHGLRPWPTKAHYGPVLYRNDVPVTGAGRRAWVADWFEHVRRPWHALIRDAVAADPHACQARFAAFTSRCCCCGRRLTDPSSKVYGIGPECRSGIPDDYLAHMAKAMGTCHASAVESILDVATSNPKEHTP
jgi:Family of unknown function (DUF6011)